MKEDILQQVKAAYDLFNQHPNAPRGLVIGWLRVKLDVSAVEALHLYKIARAKSAMVKAALPLEQQTKQDQKVLQSTFDLPAEDQRIIVDLLFSDASIDELARNMNISPCMLRERAMRVLQHVEELYGKV